MSFGILGALGGGDYMTGVFGMLNGSHAFSGHAKASDLRHHEPEIANGFLDLVVGSIHLCLVAEQ